MKRILLISGNRIAPAATGGQIRTLSIARALARMGNEVLIFSIAGRREDYNGRILFRRGGSVQQIEPSLSEETHLGILLGLLQSVARRLDYPRIWQHTVLSRGLVPASLRKALGEADIILSDLPYCPPIPGPWSAKPWILISHNLEHRLLEQASERQRRFADWMRDIESAAPQRYSDIFACAEEDQAFFRAHDKGSRLAIPMVRCGVDPAAYVCTPESRARTRAQLALQDDDWVLVFSASGHRPNVDALQEITAFCDAEAAFLAQARVFFLIVGSVSAQPYRSGALIATGRVPEILPYFAAGDAGLNMVTRGSGSNVKVFEYLAARLPVISTIFGMRGTGLQPFEDYLPCSPSDLKQVIHRFTGSDRNSWRAHAEAVWARHRRACDIQCLVEDAMASLSTIDPAVTSGHQAADLQNQPTTE